MCKRIYIADKNPQTRFNIRTLLEKAGFAVREFESGGALLEALSEEPADSVVLDEMTPGPSGFVKCGDIKSIRDIPVIMLVDADGYLDDIHGFDSGVDDYLIRPFSPMALIARIKTVFMRIEFDQMVYNEQNA